MRAICTLLQPEEPTVYEKRLRGFYSMLQKPPMPNSLAFFVQNHQLQRRHAPHAHQRLGDGVAVLQTTGVRLAFVGNVHCRRANVGEDRNLRQRQQNRFSALSVRTRIFCVTEGWKACRAFLPIMRRSVPAVAPSAVPLAPDSESSLKELPTYHRGVCGRDPKQTCVASGEARFD